MTLLSAGQWRPSAGFRVRQEAGCGWRQLFRWGESQSSDVSSAMSSDCVSDISRSLRMLSGWASVTSRSPSLIDTPGDSPSTEPDNAPPLLELQSWGSSPPETVAMAAEPGGGVRSSSLVRQRWLGLVSMSTWISMLVPSLQRHNIYSNSAAAIIYKNQRHGFWHGKTSWIKRDAILC